jgi:HAD superfamily hydrolase (TIGR01549 family)
MIEGICLDLDGTLYDRRHFWVRMVWSLMRSWIAGKISFQDLYILYRVQRGIEKARQCGLKVGLRSAIMGEVAVATGVIPDYVTELLARWTDDFQPQVISKLSDPTLRHLLTRLRLRGYRIGVYSDYPARIKLEALALPLDLFDTVIDSLSPDIDALKPHPKGFHEACTRMGLEPACVIYFGDRLETDGAGSRLAGLSYIHCKPYHPFTVLAPVTRYLLKWEKNAPTLKRSLSDVPKDGCWICGGRFSKQYKPSSIPRALHADLVQITDVRYGMTAKLCQCEACGFIRADLHTAQLIEDLYKGMVDEEYKESLCVRGYAFADLLRLILDQRPDAKSLLDIGAGTGTLCLAAQKRGLKAEGVEPSSWCVSEARRQGILIHEGYFPHHDLYERLFDVVTICDVIEHVTQPVAILQAARQCLKPDGLIVIVTPSVNSLAARIMKSRWWHFRPAHIGYFTPDTMSTALVVSGLSLERVETYVWSFSLGYLLGRVAVYLPIGGLVRRILRARRLNKLLNLRISLNLADSHVYFVRKAGYRL